MIRDRVSARRGAIRLHLARLWPTQRRQVVQRVPAWEELAALDSRGFRARGVPPELAAALGAVAPAEARREEECSLAAGSSIVTIVDAEYPVLLRRLPDPPAALWLRGRLPPADALAVTVVGTRRPTPYGLAVARRLSSELAEAGLVVVSGAAAGVDGAAHAAALEAGATSVAVLGCGVDVVYPRHHRRLLAALAERGAVVSEHPRGCPPRREHFPIRNRILAGWSPCVLVVEARARSGTLITARVALELGRDVLAVPGPITSAASAGTHRLIADGARLVADVSDVLEELGCAPRSSAGGGEPGTPGDPLLAALPLGRAVSADELSGRLGRPVGEVLARLAELEALGRVRRRPGPVWMVW